VVTPKGDPVKSNWSFNAIGAGEQLPPKHPVVAPVTVTADAGVDPMANASATAPKIIDVFMMPQDLMIAPKRKLESVDILYLIWFKDVGQVHGCHTE
jgi:hypothetical protein